LSEGPREPSGPGISAERTRWEEGPLREMLARYPERAEEFRSVSGLPVDRLYTPGDVPDLDYLRDLGFPGEYPFTRGIRPTMYRGRLWTMREYAGFGSAAETNARFRYLLEQGQTGLSVAFDLPTQMGYDSDHPLAEGEVGRVGAAVCSLSDMEVLFDGIPLDGVTTSMTINAPAVVLLAMYLALARKRGTAFSRLRGTVQNDILKEYVARGTYIFPPRPSMRLTTDLFAFCSENVPGWNTISISGYHIREAGANAVQELAFSVANAIAYVEAATGRGLEVDAFAPRLSFFFGAHTDFFEEIAKYRAARRLWARIMRERFGAKDPRSWAMRFHAQTAGSTLTAQQPENNVVRVTLQALAAVLGGTQSLHTNSKDEALALPSAEAVRTALRTQQIIAHESGVAGTIDPLAGSYYVEHLTTAIEEKAREYLKRIEDMGGAVAAIEQGFIQREIHESAYRYQRDVESQRRIVVGVNSHVIDEKDEEPAPGLLQVDPDVERAQRERLRALRGRREKGAVRSALARLQETARGDGNIVPPVLDAVEAYVTLGEICAVLREEFGEYRATTA